MSGPAPFGTWWKDGKLVPQPAEAAIVVVLAEAFLATGGRMKAIAAALNAKGFRTRRGGPWTDVATARVLRQQGLRTLLPESLWRRCERLLAEREGQGHGPGRRSAHPLGGVVRCSCGGRMYLRADGPAGKYICQECRSKIPSETLERKVLEGLGSVVVTPQEVMAELRDDPRAAEVARAVGDRGVPVSEIWPLLDAAGKRELVDLLVSRIIVDQDEIGILLAVSDSFQSKRQTSQADSSPSSHDLPTPRKRATSQGHSSSATKDGDERPATPSQLPRVEAKAYRIRQVAKLLSLPKSTVYDLVRTGVLASVRTGTGDGRGVVLVPASAVTEFLEEKRRRR